MRVREAQPEDRADWLRMCAALWSEHLEEHPVSIDEYLAGEHRWINQVFLAENEAGQIIGFVELRLRNYAEGSEQTRVPYVEGWYVDANFRGQGVGAALMAQSETWARAQGCRELASDATLDNAASIAAHRALGFQEVERVVCFLKKLYVETQPTGASRDWARRCLQNSTKPGRMERIRIATMMIFMLFFTMGTSAKK